jgi:hypothetical protein
MNAESSLARSTAADLERGREQGVLDASQLARRDQATQPLVRFQRGIGDIHQLMQLPLQRIGSTPQTTARFNGIASRKLRWSADNEPVFQGSFMDPAACLSQLPIGTNPFFG